MRQSHPSSLSARGCRPVPQLWSFTRMHVTHLSLSGSTSHRSTAVYHKSVSTLADWLGGKNTDSELSMLIEQYLRSRGNCPMLSLCSVFSRYCSLAALIDGLGFSNFLAGMIPSLFLQVRQQDITRRHLRRHAAHLCNGLILQLMQITH